MTAAPGPSALYLGVVTHQRLTPARHRLRYRLFTMLIDLDELPALARRLRLFSLNRFNLFSLHERDHGEGDATGLRDHVVRLLRASGLPADGAIRLLTMPRILGHVFNPLSVYFCHAADGALRAVLYEVNNTFGERHSYLIEVDAGQTHSAQIEQTCAKGFHVSPFLPLEMTYRFRIEPPAARRDTLRLDVSVLGAQGTVLHARLDARRSALDDAALARAFVTHPLLNLKVVAGIHWEALRMLVKGIRLHPKPPAPAHPVTVIKAQDP